MRVYFKILGGHVHCRVFTTGSKCGDLVFTVEEWPEVTGFWMSDAQFIEEKTARTTSSLTRDRSGD